MTRNKDETRGYKEGLTHKQQRFGNTKRDLMGEEGEQL
jgi:hypothetical protein